MWHFTASVSTLVVLCIYCIVYTSALSFSKEYTCTKHTKAIPLEKTDPPVVVTQRMNSTVPDQLEVTFESIQEDLNVSIFAYPYIDNEADCPADKPNSSFSNTVKYHCVNQTIYFQNESQHQNLSYSNLFTGCYYIQLSNKECKTWVKGPTFYKTMTPYIDTKIKHSNGVFLPEDSTASRTYRVKLSIPFKCYEVNVNLWECSTGALPSEMCAERKDHPTQSCTFSIHDKPRCDYPFPAPKLKIRDCNSTSGSERWTADIEWTGLKRGSASYYSMYARSNSRCSYKIIRYTNCWKPAYKSGVISHGIQDANSTPPEDVLASSSTILPIIGYVALGVIIILILFYWIWKCGVIKCAENSTTHILPQISGVMINLDYVKKSRQILLMYAKGSPDFMAKMNTFRDEIQRKCQCHVYDLQSEEDANTIADMGPIRWTEQILREGSKVIWIDTPQLRSLLKNSKSDEEEEEYARDFRNPAFLFALDHIISISENVIAQYQRYFVVRCKEFKVDNDCDDDPLLAVSPQARYPIPDRFEDLCKDICDSMPPVK
ncbi:uncharacterized protein [Neodiprion pinetum]|uniref:uncharacterized protein isoform X1 n=3 Tax=Neodiprion pinetum TaxID=441929 RepID=UPI001EDDF4F2|nr:uncharacterized protein LOC124215137 isoform X1 [Neodiprion pinetum]